MPRRIRLILEILSPSDNPVKKRAEQDREAGRDSLPRGGVLQGFQHILPEPLGADERSKKSS